MAFTREKVLRNDLYIKAEFASIAAAVRLVLIVVHVYYLARDLAVFHSWTMTAFVELGFSCR